jgi:hypothetical protein
MGLEEHEVDAPDAESKLACEECGKVLVSGDCCCDAGPEPCRKRRRPAEINDAFVQACRRLSCANLDVHVQWRHSKEVSDMPSSSGPVQDPEDELYKSEGPRRSNVTVKDTRRRHPSERKSAMPLQVSIKRLSGCTTISLGSSPLASILSKQLEFALARCGQGICWESRDHSEGYTLVVPRAHALEAAIQLVHEDYGHLSNILDRLKDDLSLSRLETLRALDDLWSAFEPGGALQLQTSNERVKELLLGLVDYGARVRRVPRAFLTESPDVTFLPMVNKTYSAGETCNEQELRSILYRHLQYLHLASTLSTLAVSNHFCTRDLSAVSAFFSLDPVKPDLLASDIFVDEGGVARRLFQGDTVLGANPRARGWLHAERLPLKFLIHRARPDQYPTAWHLLRGSETRLHEAEFRTCMDFSLTASPPALTLRDQKIVYSVLLKDRVPRLPNAAVCSQGVFDGQEAALDAPLLLNRSHLYCNNCGDCRMISSEGEGAIDLGVLRDIEDTSVPAHLYFSKNDAGDARKIFENKPLVTPVKEVREENRWAVSCYTDEDLDFAEPLHQLPGRLEDIPGVAGKLTGIAAPTPSQLKAEAAFIKKFFGSEAPEVAWLRKAVSAATLLASCALELSEAADNLRLPREV